MSEASWNEALAGLGGDDLSEELQSSLEAALQSVRASVSRDVADLVQRAREEAELARAEADRYAASVRAEADRVLAEMEARRHEAADQLALAIDMLADVAARLRAVPEHPAVLDPSFPVPREPAPSEPETGLLVEEAFQAVQDLQALHEPDPPEEVPVPAPVAAADHDEGPGAADAPRERLSAVEAAAIYRDLWEEGDRAATGRS